ncbi:MAG: Ig-like domain-containing protein [Actinomycetota bacterium]|nr:Ig-like domain-containing protein [Actinomycetota bacterium]
MKSVRSRAARLLTVGAIAAAAVVVPTLAEVIQVQAAPSTTLVISEFRVRGPNGANDEFIEIQNISAGDITVASASGTGLGIAASDGTTRCSIPNGTVIPRHGHYLCVNSVGYSLAAYAAGNGTAATGDATYVTDIPDNAGIALFNNNVGGGSYVLANQIDAVGSTSEANALYREGAGYPALTPFSIDYSFYRNLSTGTIVGIPVDTATPGLSEDTDDNATDFVFVDTNGTSAGAGQRLGAPGPENLSSPVVNGNLDVSLIDDCVSENSPPNAVRDFTSDPANNSTFGTLDLRRTITNNTGAAVTRLRIRLADQRTFPAPSGTADLRNRTSADAVITVDRTPCGSTSSVTAQGTTLEQPPSSPNGSAFNSSMSVGDITLGTPLAIGASIDVRMLFGIQQTGANAARIVVEALGGTTAAPELTCIGMTDGSNMTNLCTPNNAPVAVNDAYNATEDTPLVVNAANGVLDNDTDVDLDTLTANTPQVSGPSHGTLALSADGSFTYTPTGNYNGPDSFTYTANDGTDDSNTATVNITVGAANDAPVAVDDAYNATEDTPLVVNAANGVLDNDTDVDLDSLTANTPQVTGPSHGTLALNADGSFTYTPAANYHGPDAFTYTADDGTADSNTATANITVASVNDAPTAVGDANVTLQNAPLVSPAPGVLANDTDPDGDPLTAVLITPPSHGSVALAADGSYVYTPNAGYSGPDSFTYAASDGIVQSGTVTVNLTVTFTGGQLPATGGDSRLLLQVAMCLLLAGGTLVVARRRRRQIIG